MCNGARTGGHRSVQERTLHINSLELLAGSFAIKAFAKHRSKIQILLQMENSTAVAYVNKMGGTHSLSLSLQAGHLWKWCLQQEILLSAEHLPGVANTIADQEIRYPDLMECLVDYSLSPPKQMDLLQNPSNQLHSLIIQDSLKLLACRVLGNNMQQQAFQKKLQNFYWQGGVQGQTRHISRDGHNEVDGVANGKLILFHAASSLS